jgi:pyrimidine operon attenuation protein/uracil phosphoribosyltransferase
LQLENTVIIGIQPRGIYLSDKIVHTLKELVTNKTIEYGILDITFYRDDVRKELHVANKTHIPFSIENKKVILVDDVLWTGRTIRAALDALLDFGRPQKVELCVLIDRRFNRELPIQPDYTGRAIDTIVSQKVKVFGKKMEQKNVWNLNSKFYAVQIKCTFFSSTSLQLLTSPFNETIYQTFTWY